MKFMHLSDLHLGKRINEFSMLDDQKYILTEILNIIDNEKPDGVIIAGDIYDKSVPPIEAVELFSEFLTNLFKRGIQVFAISGNHDSPERISFGNELMDISGIHIAPVYKGKIEAITLEDEFGKLNIYMLPFIKPSHIRRYFTDEIIESYTDAIRLAIKQMDISQDERNLLITHQFVTGASCCDSEERSVGGTDNVDASVFDGFDYVALGHIHRPQNCSSDRIRYCGTPLKYSFSESKDKKSVTIVEFAEKNNLVVKTVPLVPMHDMVELKGSYNTLIEKNFYDGTSYQEDYVHITLTDEEDIPDAIAKLRTVYHNIMRLDYDNTRTRESAEVKGDLNADDKSPFELFKEFYTLRNNHPMTDEQSDYICKLIEKVWEENA